MAEDLITLEVGVGGNPFTNAMRTDLISPDSKVLLVDYSRAQLKESRNYLRNDHPNTEAIIADVSKPFLTENSIDVALAKDIFSDPKTKKRQEIK